MRVQISSLPAHSMLARFALHGTALEGKSNEINRKAVELAKTAVGEGKIFIAGSMGPVGQLLKPYGPLEVDEVRHAYADQAHSISEAGADLLVIETQFDLAEIKAAIQGVRLASKLPLVVSISYDRGKRTMMGVSPSQAGKELESLPVDVIGINCGRSLDENLQNLVDLRQVTSKPIWFKPNAGLPHLDQQGKTVYDVSTRDDGFCRYQVGWRLVLKLLAVVAVPVQSTWRNIKTR